MRRYLPPPGVDRVISRFKRAVSRAKYAAVGGSFGALIGGLVSRNAASSGAAIGALIGATIGEQRVNVDEFVGKVKDRNGDEQAE